MFAAILISMALGVTQSHEVRVHSDEELAFRVNVPETWAVSEEQFDVAHYRQVLVAMNSAGIDGLRVEDWGEGNAEYYGRDYVGRQLPVGTVYVDIAIMTGPPLIATPYGWRAEDGPEHNIAGILSTRNSTWETVDAIGYGFRFLRWGFYWDVAVYCRKPFEEFDLDQAFDVLASLRFPDVPVTDPHQAVEVVIQVLPEAFRPEPEWLEPCSATYNYNVVTKTARSGHIVEFQFLDGTEVKAILRSRRYLVTREGNVRLLEAQD